jgi:hypothetical protein
LRYDKKGKFEIFSAENKQLAKKLKNELDLPPQNGFQVLTQLIRSGVSNDRLHGDRLHGDLEAEAEADAGSRSRRLIM